MSAFTPREVAFLQEHRLGRMATIGPSGEPHVVPVGYEFDVDAGTIDLTGFGMNGSKKWRDVGSNPRVAFVVDDRNQAGEPCGVEVRGRGERMPGGTEPRRRDGYIRLSPIRIVSWGIDTHYTVPNSRVVGKHDSQGG